MSVGRGLVMMLLVLMVCVWRCMGWMGRWGVRHSDRWCLRRRHVRMLLLLLVLRLVLMMMVLWWWKRLGWLRSWWVWRARDHWTRDLLLR